MNLGETIKLCRTQKGLNQAELAKLAGISVSYLSLLERNKRDPNFSTVEGLVNALDIPMNIFIFLASKKEDLANLDPSIVDRLSNVALNLIKASGDEETKVS